MKISRITQQQGRKDRFSIYVDDEYLFSLSQSQLLESGLRSGDELTANKLTQLRSQSELGKALDNAYRLISVRSRSEREIITYLQRKQYEATLVSEVIEQLKNQDLLSDSRFAAEWVANRQLLDPRSRMELQAELRQKGINAEVIQQVLASFTVDDEIAMLVALIAKKKLRYRYVDKRKLRHYLATKGYSAEAVRRALEGNEPS